jgi:hypothetical protein
MSPARTVDDPSLPTFDVPADVPAPGDVEPELAIVTTGSRRPLRLDGRRATLHATESGSISEIRFDGEALVGPLDGIGGTVANVLVSPGRVRRERVGPTGSFVETCLVAPTLPLIAIHWSDASSCRLSVTILPDAMVVRHRSADGAVTLRGDGDHRLLTLALVGEEGASWSLEPREEGGVVVQTDPVAGPRTLVMAYGTPETVRTALAGAAHLGTHEARSTRVPETSLLGLDTGSHDLDEAVAWLSTRLYHGIRRSDHGAGPTHGSDALAWLWTGLGASAIGDEEGAVVCAMRLDDLGQSSAASLIAGRVALTTGRSDLAVRLAEATLLATPPASEDDDLRRVACGTLADALRYAAPEAFVDRLRAEARAPETLRTPVSGARGPGPVRLPTVRSGAVSGAERDRPSDAGHESAASRGDPSDPQPGAWLAGLLDGRPSPPGIGGRGPLPAAFGAPSSSGPASAARAWELLATDPPRGWAAWRAELMAGFPHGPWGSGSWDPLDDPSPPATAGLLLAGMVHGWLGAFPDAPVGRLALAPAVPAHVTRFRVTRIPVGDVRVALRFERNGELLRFDLEAERGRVPPFVALSLRLPGRVGEVRVDGAPAEPEILPGAHGDEVRLQTPVDGRRSIDVRLASD